MLYENLDGSKQWLLDPSHEESTTLSNNLVHVTKVGNKVLVQCGADINKTSFSHQASANLQFKSNCLSVKEIKEAIKKASDFCAKAVIKVSAISRELEFYEV